MTDTTESLRAREAGAKLAREVMDGAKRRVESEHESLRAVLHKLRRAISPRAVPFYLPWCSTRKVLKTYRECEQTLSAALERVEAQRQELDLAAQAVARTAVQAGEALLRLEAAERRASTLASVLSCVPDPIRDEAWATLGRSPEEA